MPQRAGWGRGAAAAAALPAGRRPIPALDLAAVPGWLRACATIEAERRRLFPWLAVAFGTGILLFFASDGATSLWPPLLAAGGAAALAILFRSRPVAFPLLVATVFVFLGFAAALHRTASVAAPVLGRLAIGTIGGFVESVDERGGGGRLVILLHRLDGVAPGEMPRRVRVSVRATAGIAPGAYVTGPARLLPPPDAAWPGGYDFARDAFYRGIGGVGSASGRLSVVDPPPSAPDGWLRLSAAVDAARNALTRRIADTIGGQAGAVAAALVTGKRGLIAEPTNDALRAAGIYHIVSISGLHMVLAAGAFFWLTRAALALSPALAVGWPIKKIAALAGMAGATAYCVFSGSDVATERSLLMILVMQGAILVDRPALSLRNLAISALLVLAREPETLLGPSFQMSYAAVAGLVAMAEWLRARRSPPEAGDPLRRIGRWCLAATLGTLATTLVAGAATAPFGTYHFHALQPYGVLGNAATLPLVSLVVMPCGLVGVLALAFGLDRPIWTIMGWGVSGVLRLAEWVAGLDGASAVVPAFGIGALLLLSGAITLFVLPATGLRWLALLPALAGLWAASSASRPDLYVARDGSGAAVRGSDGRLVLVGRVAAFTAEQWLRADGDGRRADDPSLRAGTRCDPIGCTAALPGGGALSVLADRRGFPEDCARAAIVVSRIAAPPACAALVLDRPRLDAAGAATVRRSAAGWTVTQSRERGISTPWRRAGPVPPPGPAPPNHDRSVSDPPDEPDRYDP